MPSILKKLFSRSTKDPEAAGILSSSQYGAVVASSSSDPFKQQQQQQRANNQQQQFSKKELKKQEKLAKKEAKRHAKLQKKKDKLGSFSTNVGELPDKSKFRSAHMNNNGGHHVANTAAPMARNGAVRRNSYVKPQQQQQQQSRQPVESMRGEMVEEKENSPAAASSSYHHHQQQYYQQQQHQQPQVLSPSSHQQRVGGVNNKPPLNNNTQRRPSPSYPSPQQQQQQSSSPYHHHHQASPPNLTSPQSIDSAGESSMLRGVAIHVTNSFSTFPNDDLDEQGSDALMCFSNSYDDEEYNAVALATAMGEHAAGIANASSSAALPSLNGRKSAMMDPNGEMMTDSSSNNVNNSANQKKKETEEKFVSVLDRSPFSFTSDDGENALFPALVGDDGDPFRQRQQHQRMMMHQHQQQGGGRQQQQGEEEFMSWTPTGADVANMGNFAFQNVPPPPPPPPPLPQDAVPTKQEQPVIGFDPSFADFEPFGDSSAGFPTITVDKGAAQQPTTTSSKSVGGQNNVTSILEETRLKRRSSRNNLNGGGYSSSNGSVGQSSPAEAGAPARHNNGGSINSAPAITSSYVRNQVQRSKGGSSISRVIDNLELHVNKRQGSGAPSSNGGGGGASASGDNTSAKERIRRENMSQDSKIIDMLAAGNTAGAVAVAKSNNNSENWLFDEVTGALGPRSVAADLESLGGRSNRSGKSRNSHKSHRSKKSSRGGGGGGHRRHRSKGKSLMGSDGSVHSGTSRNSYRSYKSTRSMVSQMSEQSRSVANDLLRLEAQLSMVGKSRREGGGGGGSVSGGSVKSRGGIGASGSGSVVSKQRDDCGATVTSRDYSVGRSSHHSSRQHISASARKAAVRSLRSKVTVVAPPGKLGIILANRTDSRGTVVSGVRTASVLATQVSPGDRIIAIDDEDVSQMNVKEITTIMARKSEFERVLTLLAAPKMQYD
mmetsp:Transcript_6546/g.9928  ORF Transcript_6546/g.9928 Transcript_6546/m.9928 type:complete len:944 (+) Transcript_6546:134-2965(+)